MSRISDCTNFEFHEQLWDFNNVVIIRIMFLTTTDKKKLYYYGVLIGGGGLFYVYCICEDKEKNIPWLVC